MSNTTKQFIVTWIALLMFIVIWVVLIAFYERISCHECEHGGPLGEYSQGFEAALTARMLYDLEIQLSWDVDDQGGNEFHGCLLKEPKRLTNGEIAALLCRRNSFVSEEVAQSFEGDRQ